MADQSLKPKKSKLTFKGEEKKKKKKRTHEEIDGHRSRGNNDAEEGWVPIENLEDLSGPLFITFFSDTPICLCIDDQDRLLAYPLPSLQVDETIEPKIVEQVFVGTRVIGSTAAFSFKTSSSKYLSSDKFGIVTATSEAIGPHEEWKPTIREGGVSFQSWNDKFLSVDEIAGGGFKLRADADTTGFCETFRVFCQARFKNKIKTSAKETITSKETEINNLKKFQSWNDGKLRVTKEDIRELKKAKKGGSFSEAMLDRRERLKSDKFCK